jgi:hypothetical protein
MASPLKGGQPAPREAQPATLQPQILDNASTSSISSALANAQTQIAKAK